IVWSILAATLLDGVADGSVFVTGHAGDPSTTAPRLIPYAAGADRIVLLDPERISICEPGAGSLSPVESVDPLTPLARLDGPDLAQLGDAELAGRWRALGACLGASYLVGCGRLA